MRRNAYTPPKGRRIRRQTRTVDTLSTQEVQQVRKLYDEGKSAEEIAAIFNVLPAMVLLIAKKMIRQEVA